MTDRPILFSAPMVRALLAGTKTQTRRPVRPQPVACDHRPWPDQSEPRWVADEDGWHCATCGNGVRLDNRRGSGVNGVRCPHGVPGDRLWVRETIVAESKGLGDGVRYPADKTWQGIENNQDAADEWLKLFHYGKRRPPIGERIGPSVPGIHMPRWTSRLWLTITDVRVQRLQAIDEDDAAAEGWPGPTPELVNAYPIGWYAALWDSINGKDAWEANPWVWAVSFDVHQGNIGAPS